MAAGFGLLPVSLGINSAPEMVSATACILWPGAAGHGRGFLAHGHRRESDLQWPVSTATRLITACSYRRVKDDRRVVQEARHLNMEGKAG